MLTRQQARQCARLPGLKGMIVDSSTVHVPETDEERWTQLPRFKVVDGPRYKVELWGWKRVAVGRQERGRRGTVDKLGKLRRCVALQLCLRMLLFFS